MTSFLIDADVMRRALRRLGWSEVGSFRQSLQYWEPRPDGIETNAVSHGAHRIVLPARDDASDAQELIDDAAARLNQHFGRDFEHAVRTASLMLERHLDEIEVRRETWNPAGLIEWQLGSEIVDSTRSMLSAAAKASSVRRKRYFNAESIISDEFLAQCLMGQTKIGSYVVTALTPAEASLPTSRSTKDPKKHPTVAGRSVTETLAESLSAVNEAIESVQRDGGQMDAFEIAVASGVSYELLTALEPLTGTSESGITISFFPLDDNDAASLRPRAEFSFTPEDGAVIAQARRYFEESPLPQAARITGEVTLLRNSTSAGEHQIKLQTIVAGKAKIVTVALAPPQYAEAVEAHQRERLFTIFGELENRPRGSFMSAPERVTIEDAPVSAVGSTGRGIAAGPLPPPLFE